MNPAQRWSQILAQMTPEAAERLTVELANAPSAKPDPRRLPKSRASRRHLIRAERRSFTVNAALNAHP